MTWAVWVTGLPGSGKTWVSRYAIKKLAADGVRVQHLRLDDFRKDIVPKPTFKADERELVYRSLVMIAKYLFDNGVNVIIDATANLKKYRDFGREKIPGLKEIYIKCDIKECMKHEAQRGDTGTTRDIYRKALEYLETGAHADEIGEVPGINVPYEAPEKPALLVDCDRLKKLEEAGELVYGFLKGLA